jgi:hypothetical protein
MLLNDGEKRHFLRLMRAVEGFSSVQVLTHTVLDNHWHALVYVPQRQELTDSEVVQKLAFLYEKNVVRSFEKRLHQLREDGLHAEAEQLKARYTYRMYDLSEFAKTLKQRFSQGYNARHDRIGTVWCGRFKSVLVEGRGNALLTVAAYIDLNPVRAGLVSDPKDYRFSGYGAATAGSKRARRGLCTVLTSLGQNGSWDQLAGHYRKLLYMTGEQNEGDGLAKAGFNPRQVQAVLDANGTLSPQQLLRCRVRYFTDGAVVGSRTYVEQVFLRHRDSFGAKRRTGPRRMVGGGWDDLFTARRPRLSPVVVPD